MNSQEIRKRFLTFFEKRGHAIIPSAPLIPENDSSVLFNTAGMQPLVPYLLGETHPSGNRLVNLQKCVRTNDIEEVGDKTHLTYFEMMGNWSLGDYFKEDAIKWSYEFLTDPEEGLGLDPNRLYVTVFAGNNDAPKDDEARAIWEQIIPAHRIYSTVEDNWWSAGENGPCGPDSEMFYDRTVDGLGDLTEEEFFAADDRQDVVEIWNDVFMQYLKKDGVVVGELQNKNIDTGSGMERIAAIMQNVDTPYDTDLFTGARAHVESYAEQSYTNTPQSYRILLDHMRAVTFLISDGARPSNKDQGYIVRRLIRRASRHANTIGLDYSHIGQLVQIFIDTYKGTYKNLETEQKTIVHEVVTEIEKFSKTLVQGLKEFERITGKKDTEDTQVSGEDAYQLFTTYGFPLEMIQEEASNRGFSIDVESFSKKLQEHQDKSRTASEGKFKGGLGGDSPKITAFHTATHLLLAGLRKELGDHVHQAGSNITEERTRFDFTHPEKVDRETLDIIEKYVNGAIAAGAKVNIEEMDKDKAQAEGVEGSFWEKYPDVVKVYSIIDNSGVVYSKELCGGPHVETTADMQSFGIFKIKKESSSSAGVRRIKAVFLEE